MTIEVSSPIIAFLIAEAQKAAPRECCGILLGEGSHVRQAVPAANVHHAPTTHFEIDPQALIDAHRQARTGGPQVLGYYHSHPVGPAVPSDTDRAHASGDGLAWAIVGRGEVLFWRDGKDRFSPLSYRVAAR